MTPPAARFEALAGALAGIAGGAGVALGAYAAHAAEPAIAGLLERASGYLLVHAGVVLVWCLAGPRRALARVATVAWLLGMLLFCGSLAGAALAGLPTRLAPIGGVALILGWLFAAAAVARRPR